MTLWEGIWKRVVLGHSAALSRQRAWISVEYESGTRGKTEKHLSAGVVMHKLEQKAGCCQKAWEGSDRKPIMVLDCFSRGGYN